MHTSICQAHVNLALGHVDSALQRELMDLMVKAGANRSSHSVE